MGRVFAYEDHNGFKDMMFITDHELSDIEMFCSHCEEWDELIGEVKSKEELEKLLEDHGITKEDEWNSEELNEIMKTYDKYSAADYEYAPKTKDEIKVGLFFFINNRFAFSGCKLHDAETYGDFLIYPESHYDVWDEYKTLPLVGNQMVDYDYFPRGRVVYRKTDDLFIIYYDRCVEDKLSSLTNYYEGCNYETKLDEHYSCHKCNANYVG